MSVPAPCPATPPERPERPVAAPGSRPLAPAPAPAPGPATRRPPARPATPQRAASRPGPADPVTPPATGSGQAPRGGPEGASGPDGSTGPGSGMSGGGQDGGTGTGGDGSGGPGDDGGGGAPRKPRLGRGLRILLFVSLALNLAVAGLVAGFLFRAPFRPPHPGPDRVGGALTFALSEEDRRAIGRAVFRERRRSAEESGEGREARRADYARMVAILRAEPFDSAALERILARQRDEAMRMLGAGQRALVERVRAMGPAERRAFADRFEEGLKRRDRDHGMGPPRKE